MKKKKHSQKICQAGEKTKCHFVVRFYFRPHDPPKTPKGSGFFGREMGPEISGKSRLVKYDNLGRSNGMTQNTFLDIFNIDTPR